MFGAKQEKIKDTPIFPSDIGTEKPHFKDGTLFHTGYTDDFLFYDIDLITWEKNRV